jgi:hypothetical protein
MNVIRKRALFLGLFLGGLLCAVTPFNNAYRQATLLGGGHFPLAPFFILFWLTIIAALARRLFPGRVLFSGKELLFVWVLTVISSGIAYTGLARTFFINLTAPYQFATEGNHFEEVLQPLLPRAWYPQDPRAVSDLYEGLSAGRHMGWVQLFFNVPWAAWAAPLLLWAAFVILCYAVMLCIVHVFSGQWITGERMNFPLLYVPLELEQSLEQGKVLRFLLNRFFIAGALLPVFLHAVNGLAFYFPSFPKIPTQILAGPYFPASGLFSGFSKLSLYFYPAFIGFAFLASRQISFSFFFFFLAGGLLSGLLGVLGYEMPASALGAAFGPTISRPEEAQMIGAYGVFFVFILWLSREHLAEVVRHAFSLKKGRGLESSFPTRLAFFGMVAGTIAIVFFCHFFGMPWACACLFVFACFMVLLVASRVICQGGVAYFTLTAAPTDGMLAAFGSKFFTNAGLLVAAVVQKMLFLDLRESLMPSLLHGEKALSGARNRRMVFWGIALSIVAAVAVSMAATLALCYRYGMRGLHVDWAVQTTSAMYDNVRTLIESPQEPGRFVKIFAAAGAFVMMVLALCYHRFYWWPIHPIGYLMTYSSAMRILWFSFFLGWLANTLCMRYGGAGLFNRLRKFFMGLIAGEFLMGGIWAVIGLFAGSSYQVLPP